MSQKGFKMVYLVQMFFLLLIIVSFSIYIVEERLDKFESQRGIVTAVAITVALFTINIINIAQLASFLKENGYYLEENEIYRLLLIVHTILPYLIYISGRRKIEACEVSLTLFGMCERVSRKGWLWHVGRVKKNINITPITIDAKLETQKKFGIGKVLLYYKKVHKMPIGCNLSLTCFPENICNRRDFEDELQSFFYKVIEEAANTILIAFPNGSSKVNGNLLITSSFVTPIFLALIRYGYHYPNDYHFSTKRMCSILPKSSCDLIRWEVKLKKIDDNSLLQKGGLNILLKKCGINFFLNARKGELDRMFVPKKEKYSAIKMRMFEAKKIIENSPDYNSSLSRKELTMLLYKLQKCSLISIEEIGCLNSEYYLS